MRVCVAGKSAGGLSVLLLLINHSDTFSCGASHFGVTDLSALAADTHKFESRYMDNLVGRYPEDKEIFDSRSPINLTDKFDCPVAIFQGLEDKVVPPAQAQTMYDALCAKGVTVR